MVIPQLHEHFEDHFVRARRKGGSSVRFVGLLLFACIVGCAPLAGQQASLENSPAKGPTHTSAAERALLDRYCVTCHNDKTKTDNFSLQKEDINAVGDHPEVWERVIRKLRAGMMPPPGMPRPPLAEYEGLRDWLESEIDRKAAAHPDPGSVVLHRLNRTEYANVIRDLLDLEIDVTTLLPPDDSARGFDNVAGSLTISPTLLEAYTTAATRIARTAVGFWKTPTEAAYIAPADTSRANTSRACLSARAAGWRCVTVSPPMASTSSQSRTSVSANLFPASNWNSSLTTKE